MALFLFFEALFQRLHQLVPAHLLDGGFLLGREFVFQNLAQPVGRDLLGEVGHQFDAFEVSTKGAVKLVVVLLVLHQGQAREVVEIVQRPGIVRLGAHHTGLQGFEQGEVFLHRHGQLGRAQGVEEVNQHDFALQRLLGKRVPL